MKLFFILAFCILLQGIGYSQKDSVTVYIFLREDCVISQNYTLILNQLHQKYANEKIGFIGIFPNSKDEQIAAFQQKYKLPFPLKSDYFTAITKKLGATVTPEVVVYNQVCNEILYRGRIDNTYFKVGKKRTVTTTSELEDALKAIQTGQPIPIKETEPVGCLISFNN